MIECLLRNDITRRDVCKETTSDSYYSTKSFTRRYLLWNNIRNHSSGVKILNMVYVGGISTFNFRKTKSALLDQNRLSYNCVLSCDLKVYDLNYELNLPFKIRQEWNDSLSMNLFNEQNKHHDEHHVRRISHEFTLHKFLAKISTK